ncbi:hypothetical protein [Herbidospora mongoliensis]|uniref:hypothetical protein n=1 Tax=Herbidospora mongoliensis TaxID=688067 RepID=UPI0008376EF1|nr:hypothetical protein [Herbidospora mongoliensis]
MAEQEPEQEEQAPSRWEVLVDGWVRLGLDLWDAVCTGGVLILAVGLVVWFGPGPALTVIGALVLALGIAGARNASASVLDPVVDGELVEPVRRPTSIRGA